MEDRVSWSVLSRGQRRRYQHILVSVLSGISAPQELHGRYDLLKRGAVLGIVGG